jgi:hypothetical protein
MAVFWDAAPCGLVDIDRCFRESASIIVLMMEVSNSSETSVHFYQTTWCNIPEDSHLQMEIKSKKMRKIAENAFGKYLYSIVI